MDHKGEGLIDNGNLRSMHNKINPYVTRIIINKSHIYKYPDNDAIGAGLHISECTKSNEELYTETGWKWQMAKL